MGILDKTIARSLHLVPKPVVRRVARSYIAGETIEDAVAEARRLNGTGALVTMDLLGESVTAEEEAAASVELYRDLLDVIRREALRANVSIKPTHFGLLISPELFERNLRRLLERARELGNFVRIDMEDSSTTDATLAAYRRMRDAGFDNVGVVLQARLRRTPRDLAELAPLHPSVRLCKGVYLERPEIAWQDAADIDRAFLDLVEQAVADRRVRPAIATHHDPIIEGAERLLREHGRRDYEFQMLLGVRPDVRRALLERGHPLRVYVPFGERWYAYCIRRLQENPQFAGHVTRDLLRDPRRLFGDGGR